MTTSKADYRKISIKANNGRRRSIILDVIKETNLWVIGNELESDGDYKDVAHMIDKSSIVKSTPMKMNLHDGELEPDYQELTHLIIEELRAHKIAKHN